MGGGGVWGVGGGWGGGGGVGGGGVGVGGGEGGARPAREGGGVWVDVGWDAENHG